MEPPPSDSNRTSCKKVSKACNTCRLRRKKCNGFNPCSFCIENDTDCSYSTESRRRGPASGYLRYTETRLALLEILLGLFISRKAPALAASSSYRTNAAATTDPFFEAAQALLAESKSCTQEVWDDYRHAWVTSQSAKVIDDLALSFAPYSPRHEDVVAPKPLLPPGAATTSASSVSSAETSAPPPPVAAWPWPMATGLSSILIADQTHPAMECSPLRTPLSLSRESFERHSATSASLSSVRLPLAVETRGTWPHSLPPLNIPADCQADQVNDKGSKAGRRTHSISSLLDAERVDDGHNDSTMVFDKVNGHSTGNQLAVQDSGYAGTPGVNAPIQGLPECNIISKTDIQLLSQTGGPELPPRQILSSVIEVYYSAVWSTFPILPTRPTLETLLSSVPVHSYSFTTVLLALCAYCGRLLPSSADGRKTDEATIDLWYQQARSGADTCIKKGSSVEVAQALLLLAMNDHGKGSDSQAWLLVGLAVRVGQDIDLNGDLPTTYANKNLPPPEIRLRRNIWRVSLMLDLFLSLQLGRPPASFDCLRSAPNHEIQRNEDARHPVPMFLHAVALCQIISRIYLYLYMGYNMPNIRTPAEKLTTLRGELETWNQSLPVHYRVAANSKSQPEGRNVLELSMLYHVAVILLYHPFCREKQSAIDALVEAASTFGELLEKYQQAQTQVPTSPSQPPPLPNSNMIYHIFTVAIAYLSLRKLRRSQSALHKDSVEMVNRRTRLHLSRCLDTLASVGIVWELAKRCYQALDHLMELEGLKPGADVALSEPAKSILGKRMREEAETAAVAEGAITPTDEVGRRDHTGSKTGPGSTTAAWGVNESAPLLNPTSLPTCILPLFNLATSPSHEPQSETWGGGSVLE